MAGGNIPLMALIAHPPLGEGPGAGHDLVRATADAGRGAAAAAARAATPVPGAASAGVADVLEFLQSNLYEAYFLTV